MKKVLYLSLVMVLMMALAGGVLIGCEPEEEVVEEPVEEEPVEEEPVEEEPVEEEPIEPVSWGIGASSSGADSYYDAGAISRVVNENQDYVRASPQVTAGFGEHPTLVHFGEADMAMAVDWQLIPAWEGEGEYREPHDNIRRVTGMGISVTHLMARADSGIESLYELEGKRVNIGAPGQTLRVTNDYLLEVLGLTYDDFEVTEVGTGDAMELLRDGVIDVALQRAAPGTPFFYEVTEAVDIVFLEVPDDVYEDLVEHSGFPLIRESIAAGTYPGQDEEVMGWGPGQSIICHKDADEDAVYAFTKAFWENWDDIGIQPLYDLERHFIDYDMMPVPPFHPGAERYYKEIGMLE